MYIQLDQRYKMTVGQQSNRPLFVNNVPCEYYIDNTRVSEEIEDRANVGKAYAINADMISISANRKYGLAISDTDCIIATPVYRKDGTLSRFILRKE